LGHYLCLLSLLLLLFCNKAVYGRTSLRLGSSGNSLVDCCIHSWLLFEIETSIVDVISCLMLLWMYFVINWHCVLWCHTGMIPSVISFAFLLFLNTPSKIFSIWCLTRFSTLYSLSYVLFRISSLFLLMAYCCSYILCGHESNQLLIPGHVEQLLFSHMMPDSCYQSVLW
jgi:hypothetical protein